MTNPTNLRDEVGEIIRKTHRSSESSDGSRIYELGIIQAIDQILSLLQAKDAEFKEKIKEIIFCYEKICAAKDKECNAHDCELLLRKTLKIKNTECKKVLEGLKVKERDITKDERKALLIIGQRVYDKQELINKTWNSCAFQVNAKISEAVKKIDKENYN